MTKEPNLKLNIEPKLKYDAEAALKEIGLSPEQAITKFYQQVAAREGELFKQNRLAPQRVVYGTAPMSESWKNWVKHNLERGCLAGEIRDTLIKNQFSLAEIKAAMGDRFPGDPNQMHINHDALTKIKITKHANKYETDLVQLYTMEHFLADGECDRLVEITRLNLRPSTVTGTQKDNIDTYHRSSFTCDLSLLNDSFVAGIDDKIASLMGIRLPYSEGIQAQRYDIGQEFKAHTDYFKPGTEEYKKYGGARGNRTWTCMIYLCDTEAGGGTQFVKLNKTFYPKKGMALIWNNLNADGSPNPNTLHWGMPVERGEKIIITKWFREFGTGEMFVEFL